jgi:beta-aspartyl-peptidase (threonine type)
LLARDTVPGVQPVFLVHGGAGRRRAGDGAPAYASARAAALRAALSAGAACLEDGALAACLAAVEVLEGSPLFNAGVGSVLASDSRAWCDAAVMTGDGRAGAVAAVSGIRHPVHAAAAVRAEGEVILWAGSSAALAARYGLRRVRPSALVTDRQRERLRSHLAGRRRAAMGTVGAVCLDREGRLAAATSTGGRIGKPPARVGDSPLIGAGIWAHGETCAVSATGDGEAFIAAAYAHEVHARMRHGGQGLEVAAHGALEEVLAAGGRGGAICIGADGSVAMPATAEIFQRAWLLDGVVGCALEA